MTAQNQHSDVNSNVFSNVFSAEKLKWMRNEDIRPYVFVRNDNRIHNPGAVHSDLDWFPHKVIYKNPLAMHEVEFANSILRLETKAFGPSNMAMPRWVFYDCAIVPGFVAGFAARTATLSPEIKKLLDADENCEWTPLSLFIIIPTMSSQGEWVAHNLCSVNSILPKEHQFYGIGFISKAFGLWYANVKTCCGMTQWSSPSIRLHAHYGDFEVLTSYTPVHSYAKTLTYRLTVEPSIWSQFFLKNERKDFGHKYRDAGFMVNPRDEESLKSFQRRLEAGEGPYYIDGQETVRKELSAPLSIYLKN